MKWSVVFTEEVEKTRDTIAVPLFTDELKKWDAGVFSGISDEVKRALKTGDFDAKTGSILVFYTQEISATRLMLLGLGDRSKASVHTYRKAFLSLGRRVREVKVKSLTVVIPEGHMERIRGLIKHLVSAFSEGFYAFDRYVKERKKPVLKSVTVALPSDDLAEARSDVKVALVLVDAQTKMKDLANEPPNKASPAQIAREMRSWFRDMDKVRIKVLRAGEMEKLGLNLVLAVGRGSVNEPLFFIAEYRGAGARERPIILVGKGVAFDAGGISLKRSDIMRNMKQDMSGAAAVVASVYAAAKLRLKKNVIAIAPLVENLPGPTSYKVDDVIKSYSGHTVEIINTDAEGRLILADALAYAVKMNPREVVDIATLTGAAVVALGKEAAAVMGNSREVLDALKSASEASGERVWELPMWDEYRDLIKSKIADVKNAAEKREAGAIVGAKFLETFVGDVPWAHVDMAPTMADKDGLSRGFGVGLLVHYLMER